MTATTAMFGFLPLDPVLKLKAFNYRGYWQLDNINVDHLVSITHFYCWLEKKMSEHILFTLNAPKGLKDNLVEKLITFLNISGFNLKKINRYSKEHSQFDIAKQVESYRAFYKFEVLMFFKDLEKLKTILKPIRKFKMLDHPCFTIKSFLIPQ